MFPRFIKLLFKRTKIKSKGVRGIYDNLYSKTREWLGIKMSRSYQ